MQRRTWLALVIVLLALWANSAASSHALTYDGDESRQIFGDDTLPSTIVVAHVAPVRTLAIVDTHVAVQIAVVERPIITLAPKTSPPG